MSANRSVQAAQRRQTKTADPPLINRGPQPSIGSSQMFNAGQQQQQQQQSRPMSGRIAGQNAALSQKQMMEQAKEQQQQQSQSAIGGINKMTIAQAITLITLRLGKVETQLLSVSSFNNDHERDDDDENILVDKNVIQSLIGRIDALERKSGTSANSGASNSGASNQDIALLKQQFETIKPIVVQSKNTSTALKQQIDSLKNELSETKELIAALQNLTMDNSTKILAFNSVFNSDGQNFLDQDLLGQNLEEDLEEDLEPNTTTEIMGTNLKELIEQEFNSGQ
jgi:hypothetical protein